MRGGLGHRRASKEAPRDPQRALPANPIGATPAAAGLRSRARGVLAGWRAGTVPPGIHLRPPAEPVTVESLDDQVAPRIDRARSAQRGRPQAESAVHVVECPAFVLPHVRPERRDQLHHPVPGEEDDVAPEACALRPGQLQTVAVGNSLEGMRPPVRAVRVKRLPALGLRDVGELHALVPDRGPSAGVELTTRPGCSYEPGAGRRLPVRGPSAREDHSLRGVPRVLLGLGPGREPIPGSDAE